MVQRDDSGNLHRFAKTLTQLLHWFRERGYGEGGGGKEEEEEEEEEEHHVVCKDAACRQRVTLALVNVWHTRASDVAACGSRPLHCIAPLCPLK